MVNEVSDIIDARCNHEVYICVIYMLCSTEFQQIVNSVVNYGIEQRAGAFTAIRSAFRIGNYEQLQKMKWRRSLGLYLFIAD